MTQSVLPHNKLTEFSFGILDFLLQHRLNASIIVNEAFMMYSMNKTNEWFDALVTNEKEKLIVEARKEGRKLRQQFREHINIIKLKRLHVLKEKKNNLLSKIHI